MVWNYNLVMLLLAVSLCGGTGWGGWVHPGCGICCCNFRYQMVWQWCLYCTCMFIIRFIFWYTYADSTIQLQLTSNTTRFPNVAPYNIFSLTCTATIPQRVVSPRTFTWRRRIGASTSGLTSITGNDSISNTTNLDQPTSTSVLTVRETTAGDYRYRCRVDLNELSIVNTTDVYPINVTGKWIPFIL